MKRLVAFFVRIWQAIQRWVIDPAALPEEIGTEGGRKHHRPIPIELGFYLHADGSVYFRNRRNHTQRKCDVQLLIDMVHREYAILADIARKDLAKTTARRRKEALKAARKSEAQVDTPD